MSPEPVPVTEAASALHELPDGPYRSCGICGYVEGCEKCKQEGHTCLREGEPPVWNTHAMPDLPVDDREWVAWGFANLTLPEAIRRLHATNVDRDARGEQPLDEPPFTGPVAGA